MERRPLALGILDHSSASHVRASRHERAAMMQPQPVAQRLHTFWPLTDKRSCCPLLAPSVGPPAATAMPMRSSIVPEEPSSSASGRCTTALANAELQPPLRAARLARTDNLREVRQAAQEPVPARGGLSALQRRSGAAAAPHAPRSAPLLQQDVLGAHHARLQAVRARGRPAQRPRDVGEERRTVLPEDVAELPNLPQARVASHFARNRPPRHSQLAARVGVRSVGTAPSPAARASAPGTPPRAAGRRPRVPPHRECSAHSPAPQDRRERAMSGARGRASHTTIWRSHATI